MLIDTHSHIYLPEFDDDREEMLRRAKDNGIEKIFLPNIDTSTIASMLKLSDAEHNYCFPMIGIHPCSVKEDYKTEIDAIESFLYEPSLKWYGIGECGLDYYWDKTYMQQQKDVFEMHIQLAKKNKLPLSIHSREATDDCISLIAKHKDENLQGVFHCFSGTADQLNQIIDLGFYAGIGGVVTFKNAGLDGIIESKHLPHLVLETDAPYLAPMPYRGKRNEPAYLVHILKKLNEILHMSESDIAAITSENAARVFHV